MCVCASFPAFQHTWNLECVLPAGCFNPGRQAGDFAKNRSPGLSGGLTFQTWWPPGDLYKPVLMQNTGTKSEYWYLIGDSKSAVEMGTHCFITGGAKTWTQRQKNVVSTVIVPSWSSWTCVCNVYTVIWFLNVKVQIQITGKKRGSGKPKMEVLDIRGKSTCAEKSLSSQWNKPKA